MKTPLLIALLSLWASISYAQGGYVDDLYRGSTKKSRQAETKAQAAAAQQQQQSRTSVSQQQQKQAMPVQWTPAQTSSSSSYGAIVSNANPSGDAELVTGYDEALQRRMDAYKNYKELDDSYWQLMENYHKMLTNRYDPDLYNVITFGNEMWVEPKYISALFDGSDPSAGVRGKEFYVAQPQQKTNITINVGMDLSPWGWDNPWGYSPWGWGSRWNNYYWNRPYWGSNWGWGGGYYPGGWGPSWDYPGWGGGGYYPPYHPPYYPGGGHHHYYPSRPVIWGGNRPGYGPAPSVRPGSGSGSAGRPGYTGGYRRNENGTGVAIGGAGATDRRPTGNIRPGGTQNQYNPGQNARPSTGGQATRPAGQPSTERNYRRETTTTPTRQSTTTTAPRRESTTTTTTPRRESYTPPSRSNSNSSGGASGSYGGGSSTGSSGTGSVGGGGGGGGARRR